MALPPLRTTMESLPFVVLSEIFIRLLAKQLAQMRCVCKPWNALLSESCFIKSHLHHSIHNNDEILLFLHKNDFSEYSFTAHSSCSPDLELTNFIKFPKNTQPKERNFINVIGSVNGLVCFTYQPYGVYIIWNPSLSAVLTIPPLNLSSRDLSSCDTPYSFGLGFGYDPKTDDYKFVKVQSLVQSPNKILQAKVYSMRKGSWGSISQRFPSHFTSIRRQYQVCLHSYDGHIHWLGCNDENPKLESIVSLDVGTEIFSEISLPDSISKYNVHLWNVLGVLDGKLCVMSCVRGGDSCEVWVMDEYGMPESWVKHHAFSQFSVDIMPYGFTSRYEFIFRYMNSFDHFTLYNQDASKTKVFKITMGYSYCYVREVIEYVDSLVWITPAKQLQI